MAANAAGLDRANRDRAYQFHILCAAITRNSQGVDGGALVDKGIHDASIILKLLNEVGFEPDVESIVIDDARVMRLCVPLLRESDFGQLPYPRTADDSAFQGQFRIRSRKFRATSEVRLGMFTSWDGATEGEIKFLPRKLRYSGNPTGRDLCSRFAVERQSNSPSCKYRIALYPRNRSSPGHRPDQEQLGTPRTIDPGKLSGPADQVETSASIRFRCSQSWICTPSSYPPGSSKSF